MNSRWSVSLLLLTAACSPSGSSLAPQPSQELVTGASSGIPGAPGNLQYSDSRAVYRAGRAIAPNVATLSSGAGVTFTVAPALPGGLSLNAATGEITGTPLRSAPTARYVVTAANGSGTTRFALYLTVLEFAQALEPAQLGNASSVRLLGASWGRLVDVYDRDPGTGESHVRARNLVVGELVGSNAHRLVETIPTTGAQRVTILHAFGTPEFAAQYDLLEQGLTALADQPVGSPLAPPVLPRNAALVLRFDDLVDAATVRPSTVELFTGVPATTPFVARVFPDRNHGNVADRNGDRVLEFHTTRVIVDLSASELDLASTSQAVPLAAFGLPPSLDASTANGVLRLATQLDAGSGQTTILRNLSGAALSFGASGSNDPASPSLDVVRAFRSGGPSEITSDPFEGFLFDAESPKLLGTQAITVNAVGTQPTPVGVEYVLNWNYASAGCAQATAVGDLVRVGASWLEVVNVRPTTVAGAVTNVRARLVAGPAPALGSGQIVSTFDPVVDATKAGCYVRFTPEPVALPGFFVASDATISVTFSEPMEPRSIDPLESVFVKSVAGAPQASDVVVAAESGSADARAWTLTPLRTLSHPTGVATAYFVVVANGVHAPLDASGNPLVETLPAVQFLLNPGAPILKTSNLALRFGSTDELSGIGGDTSGLGAGKPEIRGQFLLDAPQALARPRPVTRFSAPADRTQAVPSVMPVLATGVRTPLSPFGSKLQALWRYCDVGLGLLDESNYNVDVEGMAWAPSNSAPVADHYAQFEMRLSHGKRLPDESVDPAALLLKYPLSGVVAPFQENLLDPVADPARLVHPAPGGPTGYTVNPADMFVGPSGTSFVPWPMNRGVPVANRVYYTWRDTALQQKGAPPGGPGAELEIVQTVGGMVPVQLGVPYPAGQVPSIGLPLLMDFRCFPDATATGLNAFDVSLATASSSRPNFRAFSTGGVNTSGQVVVKNPNLESVATGGFDPTSLPVPGAATQPADNVFYLGQLDLVVRVSRFHTIWFDTGIVPTNFAAPLVRAQLPAGTSIDLAFRGANVVSSTALLTDASILDAYGENKPGTTVTQPVYFNADKTWKSDLSSLNGARFLQLRVTMTANAATGAVPVLDGIGIAARN